LHIESTVRGDDNACDFSEGYRWKKYCCIVINYKTGAGEEQRRWYWGGGERGREREIELRIGVWMKTNS
jgi:hypothetical protein